MKNRNQLKIALLVLLVQGFLGGFLVHAQSYFWNEDQHYFESDGMTLGNLQAGIGDGIGMDTVTLSGEEIVDTLDNCTGSPNGALQTLNNGNFSEEFAKLSYEGTVTVLNFRDYGEGGSFGSDIVITLYSDSAGQPNHTGSLGTCTVPNADLVGGGAWVGCELSSQATLSGTTWIGVKSAGSEGSSVNVNYQLIGLGSASNRGGYFWPDYATWTDRTANAICYQLGYIPEATPTPTPEPSGSVSSWDSLPAPVSCDYSTTSLECEMQMQREQQGLMFDLVFMVLTYFCGIYAVIKW